MTTDLDIAAWLAEARQQAEKSWAENGLPIGAVLVDAAGKIVAAGHNERVQRGDPTAHGEMVCLRRAGRRRDWDRLTMVTTLSPCVMCAGAILLYKVPVVVIGENRTFLGAEDLLRQHGVALRVMQDARCIELMQRLQREKPDLWAEDIGRR
jgi:cytosine deaminase